MKTWKIPPKAKIYEAFGALVDGRICIDSHNTALVTSSSGNKQYKVEWSDDFQEMTSNDNGSYWRGYLGYPMIAVLLYYNKIFFDKRIASYFKNIQWKFVNQKFKNDYDKAIEYILLELQIDESESIEIKKKTESVFSQIESIKIGKRKSNSKPPSGW